METENDTIVKGIKVIVEEELQNSETSLLSEIRFLVEHFKWRLNKGSNVSTQIPNKVSAGYQKQLKYGNMEKWRQRVKNSYKALNRKLQHLERKLESLMIYHSFSKLQSLSSGQTVHSCSYNPGYYKK